MKPMSVLLASLAWLAQARGGTFGPARDVLEQRCLECHTRTKAKGGLVMERKSDLLAGGDSGAAVTPGDPDRSLLLTRTCLPVDDEDRMPPRKHGPPLAEAEIAMLREWIRDGMPWPDGTTLAPMVSTALPRWDAPPDPAIASIEVHPETITLETAADFHRAIALVRMTDEATHDVTRLAKWEVENPAIATLEDSMVRPLADGETVLRITFRGLTAKIPLTVKDASKVPAVSFQRDVMPVLTAAGCNAGSCHGSARGQDGFHLSLYGFDPKGDHFRLTDEMPGRRIDLAAPEQSLLLTKATGEVPHTGGKLIERDSASCRTLVDWIRAGAAFDPDSVALPVAMEVRPKQLVMKGPGIQVPLTVRAIYSDGTDRDVTSLSAFTSSNDNSARIGRGDGSATSNHRGEAFLLARFHTFTEGSQAIVVPAQDDYRRPQLAEANFIDTAIHRKLARLRIAPSDPAGDETFLRRAFLDLIGLPPAPEERARFLADTRPDKRARLIDELLERPEFTEIWVMKWAELLQIRAFNNGQQKVSYKAALHYHHWLRDMIAADTPFDEIVRRILCSTGGTFSEPATNYFQIQQEVLKLAENTAQVFMGTRIQCAQCHNHPFDRWTMDDYYGFAAFFAHVKRKPAEDPRERIVFDGGGEVQHPVTKQNMTPKFLGGAVPEIKGRTRREALATWLVSPDNPWFARNVSNIVWAHFFGIGIVNPVDDVRISNPPSNPELLDALARRFVESRHDLKSLVRDICNSHAYQRSTRPNATNATDERNFSRATVRRIRAEVLLDCIATVTRTPGKFKGLPLGARAVQIADGGTTNYFLTTFGRATRTTVCSCEVKMEPNLSQALHLLNGENTQQRIRRGKVIDDALARGEKPDAILRSLYLNTLCREPTDMEREKLLASLPDGKNRTELRDALEDVFWALLNSREFIFNH